MGLNFSEAFALANARLVEVLQRAKDRAPNSITGLGANVSRRDQILAACTVPFVIVLLAGFAIAIKGVIDGVVPHTGFLASISFLVGFALMIGTMAGCFAWVKTGGFGIFAG